ncbi:FG-GAP repeat domain-containing protein [Prauserella flavalba]|nr:VCBS repeat-containing protein [Prauserella flavalba]
MAGLLSLAPTRPAAASGVVQQWWTGTVLPGVEVMVGDVTGDGKEDLVTSNPNSYGCYALESTGSDFQGPQRWCDYPALTSIYGDTNFIGDADNDGRADAIMVQRQTASNPRGGISVARSIIDGYGRERFADSTPWLDNIIAGDYGNRAADLDGDGDTDVIGLFDHITLAALSDGTTTLPLTGWGPPIRGEKATLAADATGDGKADFILVDSNGTKVVPSNANRWFDTPTQWSTTPFYGTRKTLTADIDADGNADLIAVNDTDVQVMRSTGAGYAPPELWYAGSFSGTRDTLTADVDGDGDADLIAANDNNVQVLRSQ